MIIPDLQALATPIDSLIPMPGNPRRGDVEAVSRSLAAFGQRKPIVARRSDRVVLAGNHTLLAARSLTWPDIAVVWTDDDDVTAHAFSLADNRTAELGGYDDAALAAMVAEIAGIDADLLTATGWTEDDLAAMVASAALPEDEATVDPDDVPEAPSEPVTVAGDIWLLGRHRVMCGDSRNAEHVARLLDGASINVAVTSPPYAEQRAYDASSGFRPIPPDDYVEWFAPVAANVAAHLAIDGSWFVNIKPSAEGLDTNTYVLDLVLAHVRQWGWHWGTEYCWERNGVPKNVKRRFKNQFEPVYQFALNDWKMRPEMVRHPSENVPINVGPGGGNTAWHERQGKGGVIADSQRPKRGGGNLSASQGSGQRVITPRANPSRENMPNAQGTNWEPGEMIGSGMAYPGNRLPAYQSEALGHAAAFPVGLPTFFIKAYSDSDDNIYDPFMGSGSTLVAAEQEDRNGYGMELSPAYVDIICARYQRLTGTLPVLASTGQSRDFA